MPTVMEAVDERLETTSGGQFQTANEYHWAYLEECRDRSAMGYLRLLAYREIVGLSDEPDYVQEKVALSVLDDLAPQVLSCRSAHAHPVAMEDGGRWAEWITARALVPSGYVTIRCGHVNAAGFEDVRDKLRVIVAADRDSAFMGGTAGVCLARLSPRTLRDVARCSEVTELRGCGNKLTDWAIGFGSLSLAAFGR